MIVRFVSLKERFLVRHLPMICHNRSCINPAHLEIGTDADNAQDRFIDGKTCIGEKHGSAKLNEDNVLEILEMIKSGVKGVDISKTFGVKPPTISDIRQGRTWKYLIGNNSSKI